MPPQNLNEWKIVASHLEQSVEHTMHKWNELSRDSHKTYEELFTRYRSGYPLDYLLKYTVIGNYKFKLNKHTLIPRPETEELVEKIKACSDKASIIVDVGCGCGFIGISLARCFNKIIMSDISDNALDVALFNCQLNNIHNYELVHSDLLDNINVTNDYWLVANLPYVPAGDKPYNQRNKIAHEPDVAIYSGNDGLELFSILIKQIRNSKNKPLKLFFELDPRNIPEAQNIIHNTLNKPSTVIKDINDFDRFIIV